MVLRHFGQAREAGPGFSETSLHSSRMFTKTSFSTRLIVRMQTSPGELRFADLRPLALREATGETSVLDISLPT